MAARAICLVPQPVFPSKQESPGSWGRPPTAKHEHLSGDALSLTLQRNHSADAAAFTQFVTAFPAHVSRQLTFTLVT
jgi:hypothetical protein